MSLNLRPGGQVGIPLPPNRKRAKRVGEERCRGLCARSSRQQACSLTELQVLHWRSRASDPVREAIALAYSRTDTAPRVVGAWQGTDCREDHRPRSGAWCLCARIRPELVALLTQVDMDEHIPPQLYMAIAELLAWLYRRRTWGQRDSRRRNIAKSELRIRSLRAWLACGFIIQASTLE